MAAPVVETDPSRLFLHTDLSIEPFLKHDLALRLDADHQLCPDWVHSDPHHCPRGALCPKRHVQPSPLNFQPAPPIPSSQHARTVCKHWLRGLCKKGPSCEFMHEYHLRKMPECWFFAKYGFCSNGDECMYLHVTEDMRVRECPNYRKGFCPRGACARCRALPPFPSLPLTPADTSPHFARPGPECSLKHVRRVICQDYLVGFCAKGKDCPFGQCVAPPLSPPLPSPPSLLLLSLPAQQPQLTTSFTTLSPKFDPEPDPPLSSTRIPDVSGARFLPEATFRLYRRDWLEHAADPTGRSGAGGGGFGGGGGGGGGGMGGGGGGGRRDMRCVFCFSLSSPCSFSTRGPGRLTSHPVDRACPLPARSPATSAASKATLPTSESPSVWCAGVNLN